MRLAEFIRTNQEPILADWVAFAKTCGPVGHTMNLEALRDHAAKMLENIVDDLESPQSGAEQKAKSLGRGIAGSDGDAKNVGGDTAAQIHGAGRAESGFTLGEMVAEFRALRASVIRLWTIAQGSLALDDIDDLMRFNEAIDQALAESVTRYTKDLDYSKEMFVAILGHDLRTPLNAVIMSSQFMLDTGELAEPQLTLATRMGRSARRMNEMVGDLLDFTRSRLGSGVPITRAPTDLGRIVGNAVDEMAAAQPGSALQLQTSGDLTGEWDAARIGQVITNLLANAVQHGDVGGTVAVTVQGQPEEVVIRVHNRGPAIAPNELHALFSPLKRLKSGETPPPGSHNLGLGLYIAERIVTAHGGTIDVESSAAAGTLFTLRLPRADAPVDGAIGKAAAAKAATVAAR